jgi:hypothetical protein
LAEQQGGIVIKTLFEMMDSFKGFIDLSYIRWIFQRLTNALDDPRITDS